MQMKGDRSDIMRIGKPKRTRRMRKRVRMVGLRRLEDAEKGRRKDGHRLAEHA